jgi:hypothetical protein
MNALQRRSTSGVQARCSSGVPCAITEAGEAIKDSKATRASAFNPSRIHPSRIHPSRIHLPSSIQKPQSKTGPVNGVPDDVPTKPLPDLWYRGAIDTY